MPGNRHCKCNLEEHQYDHCVREVVHNGTNYLETRQWVRHIKGTKHIRRVQKLELADSREEKKKNEATAHASHKPPKANKSPDHLEYSNSQTPAEVQGNIGVPQVEHTTYPPQTWHTNPSHVDTHSTNHQDEYGFPDDVLATYGATGHSYPINADAFSSTPDSYNLSHSTTPYSHLSTLSPTPSEFYGTEQYAPTTPGTRYGYHSGTSPSNTGFTSAHYPTPHDMTTPADSTIYSQAPASSSREVGWCHLENVQAHVAPDGTTYHTGSLPNGGGSVYCEPDGVHYFYKSVGKKVHRSEHRAHRWAAHARLLRRDVLPGLALQ
ncbi:hypothetical protein T439DRAFT_376851 [Meredithblackwellia eburnea MCA 4105]